MMRVVVKRAARLHFLLLFPLPDTQAFVVWAGILNLGGLKHYGSDALTPSEPQWVAWLLVFPVYLPLLKPFQG